MLYSKTFFFFTQGAMAESKFIRTLRQIENEAIQAPSAKAGATPLSEEVIVHLNAHTHATECHVLL